MSVVLTILKIIGIILLILLGLVLLIGSLILFVPIRYQLLLQCDQDIEVRAVISYLLHFIHVSIGYHEKKPNGKIRILGIPVYNFFPTEEQQKKKEEREKRKREKDRKKRQKQKTKKKREKKSKKASKQQEVQLPNSKIAQNKTGTKSVKYSGSSETISSDGVIDHTGLDQKEEGWLKKVKNTYGKVKVFFQKVVDKVKKLKYTIIDFCNKLRQGKDILLWYLDVFSRDESISAIKKAKYQLGRLWKHITPREIRGYFRFGFEDPSTTGDVFSKLCMLYPFYANHIIIIPDFENNTFKGELFMKGRIRIATLLHIGWKIIFDKEIRNLYELCSDSKRTSS